MSVTKLLTQKATPTASTFKDEDIHIVAPATYKESQFSCSPPLLSLSSGSAFQFDRQYSRDDNWTVHDIILIFGATNSSGTEAVRFWNIFGLIRSFKCYVNGYEIKHYKSTQEILAQVSNFISNASETEIYNFLARFRNETTKTFTGETFPVSSTTRHQVPILSVLVPELVNHVANLSGIFRIQFDIDFQANTNSAALNNQFCQSNTTTNAWDANLTFTDIAMRYIYTMHTDRRMIVNPVKPVLVHQKYLIKLIPNIPWNSVGVHSFRVNLFNDFIRLKRIKGLSVTAFDNAGNTAFNSANACKWYDGVDIFGYEIKSGSDTLVPHKTTADLHARKRLALDNYKKMSGHEMPLELLNRNTNLADYFVQTSYINLENIIEDDNSAAKGLSGRNNAENDIDIEFVCMSAISANVNMYVTLHYVELGQVDSKSGQYVKLE